MTSPMTPILQQFLSEARDFLQGIGEKLIQLEDAPGDAALMSELFRLVHTLKGNCGLFEFPEMFRVLHAAEDLMVVVRDGDLAYSQTLADRLLDAMDFVSMLVDEIQASGQNSATHAAASAKLAEALRQLISNSTGPKAGAAGPSAPPSEPTQINGSDALLPLAEVPEALRMTWYRQATSLLWISYTPEPECFFKGEDPFFLARQTPQIAWQRVMASEAWPSLPEFDTFRCVLGFQIISTAPRAAIEEHFRHVPDQIAIVPVLPLMLALPQGDRIGGPVCTDFIGAALVQLARGDLANLEQAARTQLELSPSGLWVASALRWLLLIMEREPNNHLALRAVIESMGNFAAPVWGTANEVTAKGIADYATPATLAKDLGAPATSVTAGAIADTVISAQLAVLGMPDQVPWLTGRLKAVATTLTACYRNMGRDAVLPSLDAALAAALTQSSAAPLRAWLTLHSGGADQPMKPGLSLVAAPAALPPVADSEPKFGRRAEDVTAEQKTLKVDQTKIDRLLNLIGEMVVAKNGLPYLAGRAEAVYGVRDLSREIKTLYSVINRIAEEMQDAIMQVRMMPVSFVFQRFPRLVRDVSRKLGKEISLVLEGEETEADKNIIEALADPLIHIIRNSLDHGIELPEVRRAAGKPAEGRLVIRASQEADRVIIDIIDDGKGIDPAVIKRKAYEKGIIDEAMLERITDQEAINLVFAAGFSTVEVVSDLSGRGVGMDVVRTAVAQVNGTVSLESKAGQGTCLRLSLPLSMAVTNVMIIESDQQIFGVPMDMVVETVRVPRASIHSIKSHQTTVLRNRIVPLRSLNELLAADKPQLPNEEDEFAMLVIRMQGEHVGIVVDDFREVMDIILKPMAGVLGGLPGYAGSALLGDGSVLMVLNPKELV